MLATLFQGLTLLIRLSDICNADANPLFSELYPLRQATGTLTTEDKCGLGRSSIIGIVSMCLWFVAGAFALAVPVEPVE